MLSGAAKAFQVTIKIISDKRNGMFVLVSETVALVSQKKTINYDGREVQLLFVS